MGQGNKKFAPIMAQMARILTTRFMTLSLVIAFSYCEDYIILYNIIQFCAIGQKSPVWWKRGCP
jgi:hypothetical protein